MNALRKLTRIYPSLVKPLYTRIWKNALNKLFGSFPLSEPQLTYAAAGLIATLHLTGGKVGSATVWKKNLECAIGEAEIALHVMRSSFNKGTHPTKMQGNLV
jgi:hypothetical protein